MVFNLAFKGLTHSMSSTYVLVIDVYVKKA